MLQHFKEKYDWYKAHLDHISSPKYGVKKMLEILEWKELTAPSELWYPLPGGLAIIANTYKRPVILYSDNVPNSATVPPSFSPPEDVQPIIIGIIQRSHCISPKLSLSPTLPIPYIISEWYDTRYDEAIGWEERFASNINLFRQWHRRVNKGQAEGDD